jgi:hypothetical protein
MQVARIAKVDRMIVEFMGSPTKMALPVEVK